MRTLTYSAGFFEDEEEELLTEAEAAKREKQEKIFLNLTVAVAVILAVAIFMILPYYLSSIVERYTSSRAVMTVFEGGNPGCYFPALYSSYFQDKRYQKNIYVSRRGTQVH